MFCLTLNQGHLPLIKKLKYIPVGLGDSTFNEKEWIQDCTKKNIAEKNKYYGEYTFHYSLWKNNTENFGKKILKSLTIIYLIFLRKTY